MLALSQELRPPGGILLGRDFSDPTFGAALLAAFAAWPGTLVAGSGWH
jgi:hypothetical protein